MRRPAPTGTTRATVRDLRVAVLILLLACGRILLACSADRRTPESSSPAVDGGGAGGAADTGGDRTGPDARPSVDLGRMLCRPGEVICDEEGGMLLCSPDGGRWQQEPCPDGMSCRDGRCLMQICSPGAFTCANETNRLECEADGVAWRGIPCAAGEVCLAGLCQLSPCTPGETRCADPATVESCNGRGTEWLPRTCPAGSVCSQGSCHRIVCSSGERRCSADVTAEERCTDFGSRWETIPCGEGAVCTTAGPGSACTPRICQPGAVRCAIDDTRVREVCVEPGTHWAGRPCEGDWLCLEGSCRPLVCVPGASRCEGPDRMGVCNEEGTRWSTVPCPGRFVCDWGGRCQEMICTPEESHCLDDQTVEQCNETGTASALVACGEGMRCSAGRCRPVVCQPGAQRCLDLESREECLPDGTGWAPFLCSWGRRCERGACAAQICTPSTQRCQSERRLQACSPGGTYRVEEDCGQDRLCVGDACLPVVCREGETTCLDPARQGSCNVTGTAFEFQRQCDARTGETCRSGRCIGRCAEMARQGSGTGCEFFGAVVGPAELTAELLLVNQDQAEAEILLELPEGQQTLTLPASRSLAVPLEATLGERGSTLAARASFHLGSTIPLSVALELRQGAPAENGDGAAGAASTPLLPLASWGTTYRVPGFPPAPGGGAAEAILVVSSSSGARLRIVPAGTIAAGPGVDELAAGEEREIMLGPAATLLLVAASPAERLGGTLLQASAPVAVFAAGAAMDPELVGACCADRVLEQIPPIAALGNVHLLVAERRGAEAYGLFRLLGVAGRVRLSSTPAHPELPAALDEGQQLDLAISGDLLLQSDGALLVTRLLPGPGGAGRAEGAAVSPAVAVVPPLQQWQKRIGLLLPADGADNEVLLLSRAGNPVEWRGGREGLRILDGGWVTVEGGFAWLRLTDLEPRLHIFSGLREPLAMLVTVTSPAGRTSSRAATYSLRDIGLFAPPGDVPAR